MTCRGCLTVGTSSYLLSSQESQARESRSIRAAFPELFFGGFAMSRVIRLSLVSGFVALFAAVSIVPAAHAQRRGGNYGFNNNSNNSNSNTNKNNNQGFNQSQNNNQSDQDDDDNDNNKKNKNRNSNRNNNNSNNSNNQQDNNQQNNNQQNKNSEFAAADAAAAAGPRWQQARQQLQPAEPIKLPAVSEQAVPTESAVPNFQQQSNWQQKKWQGPHNVDVWTKQYNNGPKPFSKKWYDDHPKAWYNDHNHWDDNVWIVATVPGVGAWLGWDNYPHNNTVVYDYYPGVNQQQIVDPAIFGEWFPLGVYSMMTGPVRQRHADATAGGRSAGQPFGHVLRHDHRYVAPRLRTHSPEFAAGVLVDRHE